MKTFTKAQDELAQAKEINDADQAEAEKKLAECKTEGENISRVQAFFSNLLGETKVAE